MKRGRPTWPAPLAPVLLLAVVIACALPGAAIAVQAVPAQGSRLTVDVWINKEEGGVYQPGENMRVYFRANADAYVLVYNIDTEGYIHLVYPYGPADPSRVVGGSTHQIPARHDPYELVADGPPGMEYVVAVASPVPFQNLPWYLTVGAEGAPPPEEDGPPPDDLEAGVIVGDPYVGMGRINQLIITPGYENASATNETFFYIGRPVEFPRYVCADCHYPGFIFDPYIGVCPIVTVQVDATWVRYAPVPVRVVRPRYYYTVRPNAPTRYREWKARWSTLDGTPALRTKFVAERNVRTTRRVEEGRPTPTPQELRNLRRERPGRLWMGRDQVLRVWEENYGRNRTKEDGAQPAKQRQGDVERSRQKNQDRSQGKENQGGGQQRNKGVDQGQNRNRKEQAPAPKNEKAPPPKGGDKEKSPPPSKGGNSEKSSPPPKGADRHGRGN